MHGARFPWDASAFLQLGGTFGRGEGPTVPRTQDVRQPESAVLAGALVRYAHQTRLLFED